MLSCAFCTGPNDAWRDELMAQVKALVKRPSVISTTTLQELGSQANKKPKMELPLPPTHAVAWDSPIWAQVTSSSVQLLEADKGQQKGLQSLFADLLPTAPTSTPFVFHDVHTRPSVFGSDLNPDVVMALRDKPCIPLTTAAMIEFKRQGGGYDNDENVGKAITYGRVFLQQLPRTLRSMVLVGLTDLRSITLVLVRLELDVNGAEHLSFDMSARMPDVKRTLLRLLSCEPQTLFVELPDLGASIQVVGFLGSGATSHVYEASAGGQQVLTLANELCCNAPKLPPPSGSLQLSQHMCSVNGDLHGDLLVGCYCNVRQARMCTCCYWIMRMHSVDEFVQALALCASYVKIEGLRISM